jgi:hypothetical protein
MEITKSSQLRTVARYLALGMSLPDICTAYGLPYDHWKTATDTLIFRKEYERISLELEKRFLEDATEDPVVARLRLASSKAASRLSEEVDNFDPESGASAATRIRAADSILDRIGYTKKQEQSAPPALILVHLNASDFAAARAKALQPQPSDIVIG